MLNTIQKESLIGNILGDGYMRRKKITHNPDLTIDQTYPKRTDYVHHLYDIYCNLTLKGPKIVHRKPDKRTEKVYSTIRFRTRALPCLVPIYEMFYNENSRKVIPTNIHEYLTARSLAYWIMDDGHRTVYNQTVLNTNSYTYDEILILQEALMKNFQLRTRTTEKKPGQYLIHIPVRQKVELRDIVLPYMIDSIKYKIKSL